MKKIAIIICFNDIPSFHGGSRKGIKEGISYFEQFLILYESIIKSWVKVNFEYEFYILHSIQFSDEKKAILESMNVNSMLVNYPKHPTKFRPVAYQVSIDCDYRLVLDVDMIAIKPPNFNFNVDAQAMYGGNKYNRQQWKDISKLLGCSMPTGRVSKFFKGSYSSWSFKDHYRYNSGKVSKKLFPYFNNGAILIKNSYCPGFGVYWDELRHKYSQLVKDRFHIDIDLEGQDIIGLAIDNYIKTWEPFEKGFNFILQSKFKEGVRLMDRHSENAILVHYINVPQESIFYDLILQLHKEAKFKYKIN